MKLKLVLMASIILIATAVVSGDIANSKLPFTGRLIFNGNPVTTDTEFQFRIYDDPAAGTLLFSKTTMLSPLGLTGTFYDELDTGLSFDRRVWLEVEVNNSDLNTSAILTPRREIGARAFAQQSNITHYTNASARALGDYFPFFDNLFSLGLTTNRWRNLFATNITAGNINSTNIISTSFNSTNISFSELQPQGITCAGNQIIRKNATDGWFCINDTRIASEVFDFDAGIGTVTDESGDNLIFELPNSQNREVIGNIILPREIDFSSNITLIVQYVATAPVGAAGNAHLVIEVRYISVGETTTKPADQTFTINQPVINNLDQIQQMNISLSQALMQDGDRMTISILREGSNPADTFTGTLGILELGRLDFLNVRFR
jgi:hypothetical protein